MRTLGVESGTIEISFSDPSEAKTLIFFDEVPDTVDAIRFFGENIADDDERFTVSRSPFKKVFLFVRCFYNF